MAPASRESVRFYCVRLLVRDFATSWKFYHDTIGLTPAKGHGRPPYGEFVEKGRPVLALFDRHQMAKAVRLSPGTYAPRNVGRSAVILSVTDVDATARRLQRRGVRLLEGPTDRPAWQLRTIHLRDPDGRVVELFNRPD